MRCNPTIALAIAASTLPVKSRVVGFRPTTGCRRTRAFIREQLMPLKRGLIDAACDAIWLGCAPFEVIWKTEGACGRSTASSPCCGELTTAKLDGFGNLVQVVNGSVTLDPLNFAWFTYDKVGTIPTADPASRTCGSCTPGGRTAWVAWPPRRQNAGIAPGALPDGPQPGPQRHDEGQL